MTKFDFIKKYSIGETEGLNGKDKEWAVVEVFTTYQNAFAKINEKITFKIQKLINIQFYKKNTLNHKKGDIKSLFTSQCCSKCGFVSKNNRKTQETFNF